MQVVIDRLLEQLGIEPVLLDVGASGSPPEVWKGLARHSVHIAFDPDLREMKQATDGPFKRSTVLNEAITPDADATEVRFFLTQSPFCSSTLTPDAQLVGNFFAAERFNVLRQTTAPATTLNAVLDRLALDRIDWLKLDTQGTDRRIYDSLRDDVRRRVLAVEMEPGLRGAYVGEDLFGDVHRSMLRDGLWLSHMESKGFVRMRQGTLDALHAGDPAIDRQLIERTVRRTPGWTELRYLRSIESLRAIPGTRRDYALLWSIAMIDRQFGFCLDLASAWEQDFGVDDTSRAMRDEPLAQVRRVAAVLRPGKVRATAKRVKSLMKRVVKQIIPTGTATAGVTLPSQSSTRTG